MFFYAELVPQRREILNLAAALALGSLCAQVPQARASTGELACCSAPIICLLCSCAAVLHMHAQSVAVAVLLCCTHVLTVLVVLLM